MHCINLIKTSSLNEFQEKFNQSTLLKSDKLSRQRLLVVAVENHNEKIVQFLLNRKKNDVGDLDDLDRTYSLFSAAKNGYFRLLSILFEGNETPITTFGSLILLHETCKNLGKATITNVTNVDYQQCFHIALEHCKADVNKEDDTGSIPLDYAVFHFNVKAQKALIACQSFIDTKNSKGVSPLYWMKKRDLEEILDNCVTLTYDDNNGKGEQKILVDFTFLRGPGKTSIEMAPLKTIADDPNLRSLIIHPVIHSFVYLKWYQIKCKFILWNIFFFLVLSSSITQYKLIKIIYIFILILRQFFLKISDGKCSSPPEIVLTFFVFLELFILTPFIRITIILLTLYKVWRLFSDIPFDFKKFENNIKIVSSTLINLIIFCNTSIHDTTLHQNDTILGGLISFVMKLQEYPVSFVVSMCSSIYGLIAIFNIISTFISVFSVSRIILLRFRYFISSIFVFSKSKATVNLWLRFKEKSKHCTNMRNDFNVVILTILKIGS